MKNLVIKLIDTVSYFTVSPSVRATTSVVLDGDTPAEVYDLKVVCDIDPSSAAEYCEVFANGPNSLTGNVSLLNRVLYVN